MEEKTEKIVDAIMELIRTKTNHLTKEETSDVLQEVSDQVEVMIEEVID